jgi:4-hydroxy-tetrahydrodipicolinate reductase
MGKHVLRVVGRDPEASVAAALEAKGHPSIGREVSSGVTVVDDPDSALAGADVCIDFSKPEGTARLLEATVAHKVAVVIGTTGIAAEEQETLRTAARTIPIVVAPNFPLGVNVLMEIAAEVARRLRDYHAEVLEIHHAAKVDAPSGTALRLGDVIAEARGLDPEQHRVLHREGHTGPRDDDAIGIQTLRAGDSVGEHTVYFAGPGERLELTHRALSRENFAAGAVRAAHWLVGRAPGLYSMKDVLAD